MFETAQIDKNCLRGRGRHTPSLLLGVIAPQQYITIFLVSCLPAEFIMHQRMCNFKAFNSKTLQVGPLKHLFIDYCTVTKNICKCGVSHKVAQQKASLRILVQKLVKLDETCNKVTLKETGQFYKILDFMKSTSFSRLTLIKRFGQISTPSHFQLCVFKHFICQDKNLEGEYAVLL